MLHLDVVGLEIVVDVLYALGTQLVILKIVVDFIDIQLGILVLGLLDQLQQSLHELLLANFPLLGLRFLAALCALLFRSLLFCHLDSSSCSCSAEDTKLKYSRKSRAH